MPTERQPAIRPVRFDYRRSHTTGAHTHDEHQIAYAAAGVLSVETEGSRWILPAQRLAWLPAGVEHTVQAESDASMAALYVEAIGPPAFDGVAVLSVSPVLRHLIVHLVDTADPTAETHGARRRLERVTLDQLAAAPEAPLRLPMVNDPRLVAIASALDEDPRCDRTLRDFGREVGASERTLQRLFVAETGTTFGRWRTRLRLQHGLIWLGRGTTVTIAATRAGYDQPSAFIAAFKTAYGTTPGRFAAGEGGRS